MCYRYLDISNYNFVQFITLGFKATIHICISSSLNAVCIIKVLTIQIFPGRSTFNKDRLKHSVANGDCFVLWSAKREDGDCVAGCQIFSCSQRAPKHLYACCSTYSKRLFVIHTFVAEVTLSFWLFPAIPSSLTFMWCCTSSLLTWMLPYLQENSVHKTLKEETGAVMQSSGLSFLLLCRSAKCEHHASNPVSASSRTTSTNVHHPGH